MACADLPREDQEDCVLDVLQNLLGATPSKQDYVALYAATCAIAHTMGVVIATTHRLPAPKPVPLVRAA